jgi:hypothetical protein
LDMGMGEVCTWNNNPADFSGAILSLEEFTGVIFFSCSESLPGASEWKRGWPNGNLARIATGSTIRIALRPARRLFVSTAADERWNAAIN